MTVAYPVARFPARQDRRNLVSPKLPDSLRFVKGGGAPLCHVPGNAGHGCGNHSEQRPSFRAYHNRVPLPRDVYRNRTVAATAPPRPAGCER